jgi:hypothetical protein
MQRCEPVLDDGRTAFRAVCDLDPEGIVAKRLDDAYEPGRTKWWKLLNAEYSQKEAGLMRGVETRLAAALRVAGSLRSPFASLYQVKVRSPS